LRKVFGEEYLGSSLGDFVEELVSRYVGLFLNIVHPTTQPTWVTTSLSIVTRWALLRYGLRWGKYGCKRRQQRKERLTMVALSPYTIHCKPVGHQVFSNLQFVWIKIPS
jgi:hypothetical protein